jgi:hypothetical protein
MNTNLSTTHARWLEAVMGHDIREIRHLPGAINFVGNALSQKYTNVPRKEEDGSGWSVECDWFAESGLVFDLYTVEDAGDVPALKSRFADVPVFLQAVEALETIAKGGDEKAVHRAREYMIEGGKLWHVGGGKSQRARARVECLTPTEMRAEAEREHREGGHLGRDSMKLKLTDRFKTPAIDKIIMDAIQNCGECLNFGSAHLHALLQPITRRHPFELLVGDYLAMPKGKGGYKEVGLYLDTASQRVFGFKYKTHGSAVTTKSALNTLFHGYAPWETFQTDGGSHFDNEEVRRICKVFGVKTHVVAKYSPWINGLVEGTNKILLGILKRLCAPDLGEEGWKKIEDWEHLPANWPDHFDNAIFLLNNRILRALDHTPNELFFAMVINTAETGVETASAEIMLDDIDTQQTYAGQQRFDGYARAVKHGADRKAVFDRRVLGSKAGEVVFAPGDLVQVLDPKYKKTFLTSKKILPEWSGAFRVKERLLNSYIIETIYGQELDGEYNSRRLRLLKAPKGSSLEAHEASRKAGEAAERSPEEEPLVAEEPEPSREEEGAARDAEARSLKSRSTEEAEEDWIDEETDEEEAVGESIGERLRSRKAARQATRTLPRGGGQMR